MVVGAKLIESWAEFFGTLLIHFASVLESVSIVCVFLLSCLRFHIVVSDGASASATFCGQSLNEPQVGLMDVKIWEFDEKIEIWWNFAVSQIISETKFRDGLRRQNSSWSCAARNIQDFGGATCRLHGWCSWAWCMECWR